MRVSPNTSDTSYLAGPFWIRAFNGRHLACRASGWRLRHSSAPSVAHPARSRRSLALKREPEHRVLAVRPGVEAGRVSRLPSLRRAAGRIGEAISMTLGIRVELTSPVLGRRELSSGVLGRRPVIQRRRARARAQIRRYVPDGVVVTPLGNGGEV
ncbi:hypothetical protein OH77DRAFT_1118622 [Trametes cingulata]|nr:hypothetical protein OH77DRAFT_1118622 [Trametes cingulata]